MTHCYNYLQIYFFFYLLSWLFVNNSYDSGSDTLKLLQGFPKQTLRTVKTRLSDNNWRNKTLSGFKCAHMSALFAVNNRTISYNIFTYNQGASDGGWGVGALPATVADPSPPCCYIFCSRGRFNSLAGCSIKIRLKMHQNR